MQIGRSRPPFIRNLEHKTEISDKEVLKVHMVADWPTPSWDHVKTDIEYSATENVVTIHYLGDRRPGVALQVIKSFETDFELRFPKKGTWKIVVIGKAENWESRVTVH